jgi:hypothetical protein
MKKYTYYHGYTCTLLKALKNLKVNAKACVMLLPYADREHWYILPNNSNGDVLHHDAIEGIDFNLVLDAPEESVIVAAAEAVAVAEAVEAAVTDVSKHSNLSKKRKKLKGTTP